MNYLLIAISFIALIHVSLTLRRAYLRTMEVYHEGVEAIKDSDYLEIEGYKSLEEDGKSLADTFVRYGAITIFALIRVPIFVILAYLLIQFIKLQW